MEQTVDIPVFVGGLQDFCPGQSSSLVAHSPASWLNTEVEPFQWFFFCPFFCRRKKVRECPRASAHPRRLLMARAFGWTTTRVSLGHCSRIRRSARGGTARVRTAPSGTRRWSAELAVAGGGGRPCANAETLFCLQFLDLVDMPVIVHRQVRGLCGDVADTPVVAQRQIPMVRS